MECTLAGMCNRLDWTKWTGSKIFQIPSTQKNTFCDIKDYFEVYVDVPFEQLVRRDHKGLYKRALSGELKNVAGVDLEFPSPRHPDLIIKNSGTLNELLAFAPEIVTKLINNDRNLSI